jgi:hypothetical protein
MIVVFKYDNDIEERDVAESKIHEVAVKKKLEIEFN